MSLKNDRKKFIRSLHWCPHQTYLRALIEHKIIVSNLKRLLYGKTTKQQDKFLKVEQNNTAAEELAPSQSHEERLAPKEPKGKFLSADVTPSCFIKPNKGQ
ncbi:hypothetical protein LLO_1457 [Legionella longbeachae NSW150]|uniref:Uncharacterized protein n=1 Tax=Legionella longbeachae serogroup 1 (strain NSW150) TaxID=661367 RepID=D3HSD5_LEGLN|nr:hypothetical protein LLO_1457 [Legionella longbeachae NSW150]